MGGHDRRKREEWGREVVTFECVLFLLLAGHALADYPLQGDFLANGKNRNTELGKIFWPYALPSHALIHGGCVLLITGSLWLAIAESVIHGITDWLKCEKKISLFTDQMVHVICKVLWAFIWLWSRS